MLPDQRNFLNVAFQRIGLKGEAVLKMLNLTELALDNFLAVEAAIDPVLAKNPVTPMERPAHQPKLPRE